MCEEFAPRDGTTRLSGEGGANRAFEIATGPALFPSGPSHFPRPNPKTPGGSPAFFLILLSSYLLILLSDYLFQRTQVDSLESFQVRFQQRKHFLNSPFVGSFHVQRKHRIVQGLPQEEPTGVAI